MQQPAQRQLGQADAGLRRDRAEGLHRVEDGPVPVALPVHRGERGAAEPTLAGFVVEAVPTGQQAAAERVVDDRRHVVGRRELGVLVLDPAREQVVQLLGDHRSRRAGLLAGAGHVADLPGGVVRDADRAHHPGVDDLGQRRGGLLEGHRAVGLVEVEQVDVVGAEPAQARLERGAQPRPRQQRRARPRRRGRCRPWWRAAPGRGGPAGSRPASSRCGRRRTRWRCRWTRPRRRGRRRPWSAHRRGRRCRRTSWCPAPGRAAARAGRAARWSSRGHRPACARPCGPPRCRGRSRAACARA